MKNKYIEPEFTVIQFENEDIVTSSGLTNYSGTGDNELGFNDFQ